MSVVAEIYILILPWPSYKNNMENTCIIFICIATEYQIQINMGPIKILEQIQSWVSVTVDFLVG